VTIQRVGEDHVHRPPVHIACDRVSIGGGNVSAAENLVGELDLIALSRPFTDDNRLCRLRKSRCECSDLLDSGLNKC